MASVSLNNLNKPMTLPYDDALQYLYGLINYEVKRPERYTPEVISLDRPRQLMLLMGDPQQRYPVVHVTGTKGKGSVSATCASILHAAGLKVGLYSSPNLQDFRERFRLNGKLIPRERLAVLVEQIRPYAEQIPGTTWWEVITGLAFLYFAEEEVDIAVIEVGLGGRLDATNIVVDPVAAVITSLSYDHMYLLGNTLGEIAGEKAGIIKPGRPVISAPQPEEGLQVIEQVAAARSAPLTLVGRDYHYTAGLMTADEQYFTAGTDPNQQHQYRTRLLGAHQAINAAVALATVEVVRQAGLPFSHQIDDAAIEEGLRTVNWPGRLEIVTRSPWLILDSAHNAASAAVLREALLQIVQAPIHRVIVFGASNDKDIDGMFRELLGITDTLILTEAASPRAVSVDELYSTAFKTGYGGEIYKRPSIREALESAQRMAVGGGMVCITGSLFVVGEARTLLGLSPDRAAYLDTPANLSQLQIGS